MFPERFQQSASFPEDIVSNDYYPSRRGFVDRFPWLEQSFKNTNLYGVIQPMSRAPYSRRSSGSKKRRSPSKRYSS